MQPFNIPVTITDYFGDNDFLATKNQQVTDELTYAEYNIPAKACTIKCNNGKTWLRCTCSKNDKKQHETIQCWAHSPREAK